MDRAVMSSSRDDYLTPPCIWERSIRVMGQIDLDPCSNTRWLPEANIPAIRYFIKEDNALVQEWTHINPENGEILPSRVFMNCPYNKQNDQKKFVLKLLEEVEAGRVSQAIILIASRTDTVWFHLLGEYPRCFIRGRLKFLDPETREEMGTSTFPSVVFGIKVDRYLFWKEYGDLGDIYERVTKQPIRIC